MADGQQRIDEAQARIDELDQAIATANAHAATTDERDQLDASIAEERAAAQAIADELLCQPATR